MSDSQLGSADGSCPPPPFVSVIISVFNAAATVEKCLETLFNQRYPRFEVVIVDDGSTDDTLGRIAGRWCRPDLRVIASPENRGVAAARNIGMQGARGEVFVFTDADCYFEHHWLQSLVAPLRDPQIGVSGGPDQAPPDAPLMGKCIDYSMHSLIASGGLRRGRTRLARFSPAGCNLAVKREVIEQVGEFNPALRCRGEEKELEHRIRRAGYAIAYVEQARVWHRRRPTLSAFLKQTFASGKGRVDIVRLSPGAVEPAHLFPALLTAILIVGGAVACFHPGVRRVWLSAAAAYLALLVLDGTLAAVKLRQPRAVGIVPVTSAVVHFGYGAGSLVRWLHG